VKKEKTIKKLFSKEYRGLTKKTIKKLFSKEYPDLTKRLQEQLGDERFLSSIMKSLRSPLDRSSTAQADIEKAVKEVLQKSHHGLHKILNGELRVLITRVYKHQESDPLFSNVAQDQSPEDITNLLKGAIEVAQTKIAEVEFESLAESTSLYERIREVPACLMKENDLSCPLFLLASFRANWSDRVDKAINEALERPATDGFTQSTDASEALRDELTGALERTKSHPYFREHLVYDLAQDIQSALLQGDSRSIIRNQITSAFQDAATDQEKVIESLTEKLAKELEPFYRQPVSSIVIRAREFDAVCETDLSQKDKDSKFVIIRKVRNYNEVFSMLKQNKTYQRRLKKLLFLHGVAHLIVSMYSFIEFDPKPYHLSGIVGLNVCGTPNIKHCSYALQGLEDLAEVDLNGYQLDDEKLFGLEFVDIRPFCLEAILYKMANIVRGLACCCNPQIVR
jgi:hypothetical protein